MKKIQFIILALLLNINNVAISQQNADTSKKKSFLKNMSFEFLGMRSIVFQKEPFPRRPIDPATDFSLFGYIPRATYSVQLGVQKYWLFYKSFFYKGGIQFKLLNSKYEKVENWQPLYLYSPNFRQGKYYIITQSNYLGYQLGTNQFCLGVNLFALHLNQTDIENYFSYLIRYEKNILNNKNRINLIAEIESQNFKLKYLQCKIGLGYKLK